DRVAVSPLPAARRDDASDRLPLADRQGDPVDRMDRTAAGMVMNSKVLGLEDGVRHDRSLRTTGFTMSLRTSPRKLSPIVRMTMTRPGKKDDHQMPTLIRLAAAERSSPQSAVGACTPRPR